MYDDSLQLEKVNSQDLVGKILGNNACQLADEAVSLVGEMRRYSTRLSWRIVLLSTMQVVKKMNLTGRYRSASDER